MVGWEVGESESSTAGARLGALGLGATDGTADGTGAPVGALDGSSTSGGAAELGMDDEGGPALGAKVTASQPHGTVSWGAN